MAQNNGKPVANPMIILREEFDDWAILFDPDSGEGYGLNPVGVFVWKNLDGRHSAQDIALKLHENNCEDMPEDAIERIQMFLDDLTEHGLAGFEIQRG
jgi:SynChlorMet cassette protein ScmD